MSELNKRQWALYNYLKDQGDEWTTQFRIAIEIPEYGYIEGEEDPYLFHDNHARKLMTADIRAINDSSVIQKIIISSGKGIKIANKQEFEIYIRKEIMAAVRRLLRAKRKAEKGSRDGQMKLVFNSERDTVKAFLDSDAEFGARLKKAREERGLHQTEAVRLLQSKGQKIDAPMLSRFERGYCLPSKTTVAAFAEIYDVSPLYLLTGELPIDEETSENNGLQAVLTGGLEC